MVTERESGSTPLPVIIPTRTRSRVVHDNISQCEEAAGILARQGFGEEVREVLVRVNEWDFKLEVLDAFANEEV